MPRPRATHGQPDPADPATPGHRDVPAGAGHLIAGDPGLQPSRCALPVPIGDQQGAALLPGPCHHHPGPARRHRTSAQPEHHQIHPVHQHRGHLDGVGARVGDHREPAQIGAHLHRGQQSDIGLADDHRMPTRGRHRRHHAQRQRPGTRGHRDGPARQHRRQALRQRLNQGFRRLPAKIPGPEPPLAARGTPRCAWPTFPDTEAILRRRCSTCSERVSRCRFELCRSSHNNTSRTICPPAFSNVCSMARVNTYPPTASSYDGQPPPPEGRAGRNGSATGPDLKLEFRSPEPASGWDWPRLALQVVGIHRDSPKAKFL